MRRRAAALAFLVAGALLGLPLSAAAYFGPGAGFAFVTSFFVLLSTLLLALLAILGWPARLLLRLLRRRRPPRPPRFDRVVIVGLDGLDPTTLARLAAAGRLPHLQQLAKRGGFGPLATTCPALSPVAWSSFATGVDPSRHGVFDFVTRDRRDYQLQLSSTEMRPPRRALRLGRWQLPLSQPRLRLLRRSVPFWQLLGRHGVPSTVLRVPISFPPDDFDGKMLSAMCVPDLLGTQGCFTLLTEEQVGTPRLGGRVIQVARRGARVRAELPGPPDPWRRDGRALRAPLRIDLGPGARARLQVGSTAVSLEVGKYSEWIPISFRALPGLRLQGICRFRLLGLDPLRLYVTPIHIDPVRPALPISRPFILAPFLAKLIGRFATLGLPEDTGALSEGVLDDDAFLEQVQLCHAEREAMFFEMLRRTPRGLCACVFDGTDRVQHMFLRDPPEPGDPVEEIYLQMDQLLGRVMRELPVSDPRQLLLVVSDHGFAPFTRVVHLNAWLQKQGYLVLEEGRERCGEGLHGVDWRRTRAYAFGLAGITLNLQGRERHGVVSAADASRLRGELAAALTRLEDPVDGRRAVARVFDSHELYSGPYLEDAPDLIVGYAKGYRASWETARGEGAGAVIEENTRHWRGDHCIDPALVPGVILSSQPLRLAGAAIADVAPTVLESFGVPAPEHMTGRSLLPGGEART